MDIEKFIEYKPQTTALEGRTIIVTGAGDGIGKACALEFAKHGATVILLGRTLAKLEATYDHIETQGYPQPAIFPINFESAPEKEYQELKQALEQEFGHIDGILHNASELGPRTPIANYSTTEWQKVIAVNTTAPFMLTKALLPLLYKSADARVIFTGSSVGRKGRAYWGGYAVSKGSLETLAEVLADELDQTSIRVNSIDPGPVRTAMRASAYPAENPNTVTAAPAITNRYVFLMGPDSADWHGLQLSAQP